MRRIDTETLLKLIDDAHARLENPTSGEQQLRDSAHIAAAAQALEMETMNAQLAQLNKVLALIARRRIH
jgi:hypothetical protein